MRLFWSWTSLAAFLTISSAASLWMLPEWPLTFTYDNESCLIRMILIIGSIMEPFGDCEYFLILWGLNLLIPSKEAWESVKIVTELIICRTARRAVQIAINSALVEKGHIVEAQPNVIFSNTILLVKTNEIYFLFLRQFEDAFENIGSLFKIKALKMVCYICNYILIFRFCKYTNNYILFKRRNLFFLKMIKVL